MSKLNPYQFGSGKEVPRARTGGEVVSESQQPQQRRNLAGRGKEQAPLAGAGGEVVGNPLQSQQLQILTPENAEYQRYSELIKRYLDQVAEWEEIFQKEQYVFRGEQWLLASKYDKKLKSRFEVVQTPEGLAIDIARGDLEEGLEQGRRPERVIYAEMWYQHDPPEKDDPIDPNTGRSLGTFTRLEMKFTHGLMGTDYHFDLLKEPIEDHPFVDPEGRPLKEVSIGVQSFFGDTHRQIDIDVSFPKERKVVVYSMDDFGNLIRPEGLPYSTYHVKYLFKDGQLEVLPIYPFLRNAVLISNTYATDLLDTLNRLIPKNTSPTPQPEYRATPELQSPKALPPVRRTQPPGREHKKT